MLKTKSLGSAVLGAALAVAATVAAVGSAQAKTYPGAWDPGFGSPFDDLGWKGTGDFYIPDACEASSGWILNSDSCSAGGMSITNVQLSFYNFDTDVVVETFALAPVPIYQMYWNNGIKGVESGFYAAVTPTNAASMAIAGGGVYSFHMRFEYLASPQGAPSVQLYYTEGSQNPICVLLENCKGSFGQSENLAILTVVPEPATYALMIGGLLVVGAAARRRKA
ncbi:MAG: PEP-CTERM sorting domain-containing protein [Ideonella sp.]|nr:PEP-CTERM sorting domain-containing protein [Ideonella sp.]